MATENKHEHKWMIVGTAFRPDIIEVDVICEECKAVKTALVDKKYEEQVFDQARNHEYLNVPVEKMVDFK